MPIAWAPRAMDIVPWRVTPSACALVSSQLMVPASASLAPVTRPVWKVFMPITQVDIANEALDLVGASTILSLNDPTPEARIVARQLWATVDRVLQSYPFACALKRATLMQIRRILCSTNKRFGSPKIVCEPTRWRPITGNRSKSMDDAV